MVETGTSASQEGGKFTGTEGDAHHCLSIESGVKSGALWIDETGEFHNDSKYWYLVNSCDISVVVEICEVGDSCAVPVNVDKLPKWENNKPTQDELHKKWKLEKGNNGWRLNEK